MSESLKGRTLSEEHRQKLSESLKGENHPFFGKHHTEESRRKMSESRKGKKQSPEEIERRRNSMKKFYQEHPEKREDWSKHFKSIKRTESWCKNISKSLCKSLTAIDVKTREEHHFSSLAEACEFLQARVCGNISTAVKTKKPYRGFYWSRP